MPSNPVTTRDLARHLKNFPPSSFKLPDVLNLNKDRVSIRCIESPLSIMTQNMALIPDVGPFPFYDGTNRGAAVKEIIERIKILSPDVVGLCEVWVNSEREQIRKALKNIYPFFSEGPDEADHESDGGCLLLSKHEIISPSQIVYSDAAGIDSLSNKGVLHIRIQTKRHVSPPYNIFYSHAQDIAVEGGTAALYKQMSQLADFMSRAAHSDDPAFVMGDLNIPGEMPHHHNELITRLGNPVDLWLVSGGSRNAGFTFVSDNNFYEDPDDNPHLNQRLDYILMRPGKRLVPILDDIEILRFKLNGRDLSDHFGLRATFEQAVAIDF